jgi:hypothetical protein
MYFDARTIQRHNSLPEPAWFQVAGILNHEGDPRP